MRYLGILPVVAAMLIFFESCSITSSREKILHRSMPSARIQLPDACRDMPSMDRERIDDTHEEDTLMTVHMDGRELTIMNAVRDENGEMVATDVIAPAYVTARFRNVAERHGKVDLEFQIIVPPALQDSRWQLRLSPSMVIVEDTTGLDPVIITGNDYRKAQLRGCQQYERFLASIITDPDKMMDKHQLEVFLQRNLPGVYAFRNDSSYVSDEMFLSHFGVSESAAADHYTSVIRTRINDYRKARIPVVYRRFVKSPIVTEGIRLDTVMAGPAGEFVYNYVQTVQTGPHLRKADIYISGKVYDEDRPVYSMAETDPLTFYISSLSTLVDDKDKYINKIIERRASANTACYVDFEQNSSNVVEDYGNNREEIARIRTNLREILRNEVFDLDSVTVTASASPEGDYKRNASLAAGRSVSVTRYFSKVLRELDDSLRMEEGAVFTIGDVAPQVQQPRMQVHFISRSNPENWRMLDALVENDTQLSPEDKALYRDASLISDPDSREEKLRHCDFYPYLRASLYPRTRTVCFNFYLHRKGMVKDTVVTTVVDTTYMRGVQAVKDRDYKTAVTLLRPYNDYNTAVAYCAMDYNNSALSILECLPDDARVDYMLALVYSRLGREAEAVGKYKEACDKDHSFVYRGNLDPEISELITKYKLDK